MRVYLSIFVILVVWIFPSIFAGPVCGCLLSSLWSWSWSWSLLLLSLDWPPLTVVVCWLCWLFVDAVDLYSWCCLLVLLVQPHFCGKICWFDESWLMMVVCWFPQQTLRQLDAPTKAWRNADSALSLLRKTARPKISLPCTGCRQRCTIGKGHGRHHAKVSTCLNYQRLWMDFTLKWVHWSHWVSLAFLLDGMGINVCRLSTVSSI